MPRNLVKGEGPTSARVIGIGESPGRQEDIQGRPFIGASGHKLTSWLINAGLDRREIRIDNVCQYRPPRGDDIESFGVDYLAQWIDYLHERIAQLEDPWVLVPMGNYATFALTGKGKVKAALRRLYGDEITATAAEKKVGITRLRGSIYQYVDRRGRKIKVIPTIHPAAVLHGMMKWEKRCKADWIRIAEDQHFRELRLPQREHIINVDPAQAGEYVELAKQCSMLSIDIETDRRSKITCFGFTGSPDWSVTFPTFTKEQFEAFQPYIKLICECAVPKVLQNGLYDAYWLRRFRIDLVNWQWDTLCMHHAIDPVEEHKLEYLASRFTREPYYKDECKDDDEVVKFVDSSDALQIYNGKDVCVTHEIREVLVNELVERHMLPFYHTHYSEMFPVLLETMLHGVRVDTQKQKDWRKRLLAECKVLREELAAAAGEELFPVKRKVKYREPTQAELEVLFPDGEGTKVDKTAAKEIKYVMTRGEVKDYDYILGKDFSQTKLRKFFYETLGLPEQTKWTKGKDGKKRVVTLDETALRTLTIKFPDRIGKWGLKVLKHRENKKLADYMKGAWDKDGRIRCSYKFTTEAGRLASSKNPMNRGYNLQNIAR